MGKSINGKELGRGISQRSDGLYRGRFTNRFGVRQELYDRNLNELRRKMRQAQTDDDYQLNIVNTNMTLDEFFDVWMSIFKVKCRESTKRTYRCQYNRLKKGLGWRKLKDLNLVVMQSVFNNLKSDASRADCRALLVDMLNRAVETGLLIKHSAEQIEVELDYIQSQERRILTPKASSILLDEARKMRSTMLPIFILALEVGMRVGEILGLTWDDVDLTNNIIHIRHTLVYLPGDGNKATYMLDPPKTKAILRDLPMTVKMKSALLRQKMRCNLINSKYKPLIDNLVFPSRTNQPLNEANVRSTIRYIVGKIQNEVPDFEIFTMHCLRHTFATRAIEKGMRPKTLQKILGHSSIKTTMDLYCHVPNETIKEEMQLLGAMA